MLKLKRDLSQNKYHIPQPLEVLPSALPSPLMSRKLYNSQKKELADEKKRLNNLNELDDFSGVAGKMNTWVQISNKKSTKKEATKRLRKKAIHIKMIQVVFLGKYFDIKTSVK